jgi:hypothetical protein
MYGATSKITGRPFSTTVCPRVRVTAGRGGVPLMVPLALLPAASEVGRLGRAAIIFG